MKIMSKRWTVVAGVLSVVTIIATALFLSARLNAGGIPPTDGWHYDQLLVYTKMSTTSQNNNPVFRDLYIFDTVNNQEKKLPGISVGANSVIGKMVYSPTLKKIAYSSFKLKSDNTPNYNSCSLKIYDLSKYKVMADLGAQVNETSGCSTAFSWSPDGTILIFKHFIDYDYGNFVSRYIVIDVKEKKYNKITKVGTFDTDNDLGNNIYLVFGWYDPSAFITRINGPDLVKVTFPAPRYVPVTRSIPGASSNIGKVAFDTSFKKDLLYSLSQKNFQTLGNQVATIPFSGGIQTIIANSENVADFILMRYQKSSKEDSTGMIKELVYLRYGLRDDPANGFYTIDPISGVRTFIVSTNVLFGNQYHDRPVTEFLSFDSGPGDRFYYRTSSPGPGNTTKYVRQSTGQVNNSSEVVVDRLSETEF